MSNEQEGKMSTKDSKGERMERMDSQCSRKHKRQNQPPSALFMDKDSLSNRLSQVKSMGSADDGDPLVKKESKIENLDLSQITDDDSKEDVTEEKNGTGEDINSGEETCIENVDESQSKKLADTGSTDSIRAVSEIAFPEETITPQQSTDREDGKNDVDVTRKRCSVGEIGKDLPEAIGDDSPPRNPSNASVSDSATNASVMGLNANTSTHKNAGALVRSSRKKAKSDAKQIIEKQKQRRSYSYSKEVIPPIGRGRYASDASSQPSKTNQNTSRTKGFWSRCPCEAMKFDPQLKTKVCSIM